MKASALLASTLMFPLLSVAAQVEIGIKPLDSVLDPGETTFVDLVATYAGSDKLLGGALSLSFDASLLEVRSVTLKAPQDIAGSTGTIQVNGSTGTISGIGFASFAGAGGVFDFARIEFRAKATLGTSVLSAADANDPVFSWASESLESVSFSALPAAISVVPEPQALAMLLAGLGLLGAAARRRG